MQLHVNHKEYLVGIGGDDYDQFVKECDRRGVDRGKALVAIMVAFDGPLGAYHIGTIDWEGHLICMYAESGFSMSALPGILSACQSYPVMLGYNADNIQVIDKTPEQGPDDPDFDPEATTLSTMFTELGL